MFEASRIIARFGGIRPMAAKLGVPVTTVQGWKERGTIPRKREADIRAAAARHGIALAGAGLETPLGAAAVGGAPDIEAAAEIGPGPGMSMGGEAGAAEAIDGTPGANVTEPPGAWGSIPEEPPAPKPDGPPGTAVSAGGTRLWRGGLAGLAIGLLIAVSAGGAGWYLGSRKPPPDPALKQRLAAAEARLAELGTAFDDAVGQVKALSGSLDDVRTAIVRFEDQLAKLPSLADAGAAMERVRDQAAALVARLDGIEDRLERLATGAAGAVGEEGAAAAEQLRRETAAALARLRQDMDAALAAVESQGATAAAALKQETERLSVALDAALARLSSSEAAGGGAGSRDAALVLAIGELRDAAGGGGPYAAELAAVRALAGSGAQWAEPLDALTTHESEGVATLDTLRDEYDPAARAAILAAGGKVPQDWLERAIAGAKSLVTVRRVDDAEGDDADAVIARAERALERGRVTEAEAELGALDTAAAAAIAGWRERARAHAAVRQALGALHALAVARLARQSG